MLNVINLTMILKREGFNCSLLFQIPHCGIQKYDVNNFLILNYRIDWQ